MHVCAGLCACGPGHIRGWTCALHLQSEAVGKCSSTLGFEVVSGERLVSVPLEGNCEYPRISTDYRNVFYRKVCMRMGSCACIW